MLSEVNDFAASSPGPAVANILIAALAEKQAAIAAIDDFAEMSSSEINDMASNAAGLYARERAWLAVEYLCAQALAQALDVARPADDGNAAH
jgi:hypothetical protein